MSKKVYIVGDDVYASSSTWKQIRQVESVAKAVESAYYRFLDNKINKRQYLKTLRRGNRAFSSFLSDKPKVVRVSRDNVPTGYRKRSIDIYTNIGMTIEDSLIIARRKRWWNWGNNPQTGGEVWTAEDQDEIETYRSLASKFKG